MNIEQIKTDLSAGVIVSPATWRKLVEAAVWMQLSLKQIADRGAEVEGKECALHADITLSQVEVL